MIRGCLPARAAPCNSPVISKQWTWPPYRATVLAMLHALALSLGQLLDARFLAILLGACLLTLLCFAGIWYGLDTWIDSIDPAGWPGWAVWLWSIAQAAGALLLIILALFLLFPAVATAVMGVFLDRIVDAVEARHYPMRRAPRDIGMLEGAAMGLGAAGRMLLWNIAALPAYLLLLFTAIGPFALFLIINSFLLGREYLQMVAARHIERGKHPQFFRSARAMMLQHGLITSAFFMIPVANLLAPLIGAALATHLVHRQLGDTPGRRLT